MIPRAPARVPVLVASIVLAACHRPDPYSTWQTYLGDPAATHYSSLAQIDTTNVTRLEVAWTYRTGDATASSQIQCNPIVVGGVLFGTSPGGKLFALDAATGEERWVFDPFEGKAESSFVNRGVTYWSDGSADERVFLTAGDLLYAVDAKTGTPVQSFGDGGRTSLKAGLGDAAQDLYVVATSPGVIYRDLLILGGRVAEGPGPAAPGHVRAFDVRTGELVWVFHTIPAPGEPGAETWPAPEQVERYRIGGANAWAGMSVDRERGLVFVPTGSATFDFYGGLRPGDNLYANSLLALDARTGERRWHYQVVRHDLWDRDLPAPPNLVTIERDGRRVDAVAQITKSGHVWVFDRETGAPLFPVEELKVPPSELRGEVTAPSQRLPLRPPPFARQAFTKDEITDISPEAHASVQERLAGLHFGGQFLPPSTEGTVIFPGFDGGGEWGGAAFDPATGWLYVNSNEMPWILTLVDLTVPNSFGRQVYLRHCAICHRDDLKGEPEGGVPPLGGLAGKLSKEDTATLVKEGRGFMPAYPFLGKEETEALIGFLYGDEKATGVPAWFQDDAVPYGHTGYHRFLDPEGYPAVRPPWGLLTAYDLSAGKIVWKVPLGEVQKLMERGIPKTGTENYGGPVVTAGGLVFIAASKDEHVRAFDKQTGQELWSYKLPYGGYATPATYEVGGRQFVVIAAGGGKMGTASGDVYVAFALQMRGAKFRPE